MQSDCYLGKLDVCYDKFDAANFELNLKPKTDINLSSPKKNLLKTLTNDAKKYRTHEFNKVLNQPHYTTHFQSKTPTDENVMKFKLFQLFENIRPPYFGTLSKDQRNITIPTKNPFYTHNQINYTVDSDEEWYEEEPGEDLSKSDGDEDLEQIIVEEDDLEGFLVPHGYLSEDEQDSREATNNTKKEHENNNESKRKAMSTLRPVIFGITYLEDGTDAAENFAYFLKAENIGGGILKYSPEIIKTLQNSRTPNSNRPPMVIKSKKSISLQSVAPKRKPIDPLEIDRHICEYFVKCERVKNLTILSTQFHQHWINSFPNEPKLSKKLVVDRLKILTIKSNNVYTLKDTQGSQL